MKHLLPVLLVLLVTAACKKEQAFDPFEEVSNFTKKEEGFIRINADGKIVYYAHGPSINVRNYEKQFFYYGDTLARCIVNSTNVDFGAQDVDVTYYLNSDGTAHHFKTIYTSGTPDSAYGYISYYPDGFLKCYGIESEPCMQEYEYLNNNFNSINIYEYSDIPAKIDLYSTMRDIDNNLTGKDDANLPKTIKFANYTCNYYYKTNAEGYVISRITETVGNGPKSYSIVNYTYEFVE